MKMVSAVDKVATKRLNFLMLISLSYILTIIETIGNLNNIHLPKRVDSTQEVEWRNEISHTINSPL